MDRSIHKHWANGYRRAVVRLACYVLAMSCLPASVGCQWAINGLLDPSDVGFFLGPKPPMEIRNSISLRDQPPGVPGATDPTPDDLVAVLEEYRIAVGDRLSVRILDLVGPGLETMVTPTVNEVGKIMVPELGWLYVEGMTARQLQKHVEQVAIEKGKFSARGESEPLIEVTFISRIKRQYTIHGAVAQQGAYPIPEPDYRLLDALMAAGGVPETVQWVYVYRGQPRPTRTREAVPARGEQEGIPPVDQSSEVAPGSDRPPPVAPVMLSTTGRGMPGALAMGQASDSAGRGGQPATKEAPRGEADEREKELIEALEPERAAEPTAPPAATSEAAPPATPPEEPLPEFILENNKVWTIKERGAKQPEPSPPGAKEAPPPVKLPPAEAPPPAVPPEVDWEALGDAGAHRIIVIPAAPLRSGEARYDIVIRARDRIFVDTGPVGEFYMMGHVLRPGPYSLTGRQVTLRQGIAAAGGLDAFAWPSRCEIVRRIDQDREEIIQVNLDQIFAGNEPDFYLRPNDLINVGTHAAAPFLAAIRNAFRLSWGFGFVYDRNFADIDTFTPRRNPRDVNALQQRFPGLTGF